MGMCPLCNGFYEMQESCPSCGNQLEESGRLMDFFDDYSPYMPIDLMKLEDGYSLDFQEEQCPHVFKCPNCGYDEVKFIQE
ncbi:hypothetical protein SM124_00285 [Bacillus sp. 31A1R]|uniref:Uncharacterized protein n=1 Tax=Robertmurraya mangrovi TaxID=3098077 RepID=A0ABU5ISQ2_9BACI|nr:hypothetical protein [Bacillus sp. 31A1R]MDZ5470172.1 hypothetical protein [Bacillus sp. 31A1R]